jgi:hypothetical protein
MNRKKIMGIAAGTFAVGIGVLAARADAPAPPPPVHDGFGEADEEVTAVIAAPVGMSCGSWGAASLQVQTSEPATGFTGACLLDRPYGTTLPTVCYSPPAASGMPDAGPSTGATYSTPDGHPLMSSTPCTIPASQVVQPSWSVHVDPTTGQVSRQPAPNSYRRMVTCAPHLATPANCDGTSNGGCPCFMMPVSRSCCTPFATAMTLAQDGLNAQGTALFSQ